MHQAPAPGGDPLPGAGFALSEPPARLPRPTPMIRIGHWMAVAAAAIAAAVIAGCGTDRSLEGDALSTQDPPAESSMSTNPPPTLKPPSGPPTTPSDPMPTGLFVGRVIDGGSGPCYTVETDDGLVYAVNSPTTGDLAVGATVRVKIATTPSATDCGAGIPVTASSIELVS